MAPFILAAIVASSLFGTGTVVKSENPTLGTALQGAGVGALIGGGLGAAAGTAGGTASFLGTTGASATVGTAAVVGGSVGAGGGAVAQKVHAKKKIVPELGF